MLTSCTWFLSIMLNLLSFLILTICNSKGMNETERSYGSTFQSTVKEKITVFISFLLFFFSFSFSGTSYDFIQGCEKEDSRNHAG